MPHFLSLNRTVNFSVSKHLNPGYFAAGAVWAFAEGTTGWSLPGPASLALVPLWPHRATEICCWPAVQRGGPPRQRPEAFLPESFNLLTARSGDGRPSGEEKECAAISQHLLP